MRERYRDHFSAARLRRLAVRRHGSAHHDLWDAVSLVMTALGRTDGEPRLGLPGLGGLFTQSDADVLTGLRLGNQPLLSAIRSLSIVQPKGQPRRLIDFRHLGAEELGSIYESLLELSPRHDPTRQTFTLETLAGNDRKTTGSYYTPTELVDLVLDTALDPVLDDAEKQPEPRAGPAAPSRPATRRSAADISWSRPHAASRSVWPSVRTGEIDPTPSDLQDALHDVVARCIYGVDVNPHGGRPGEGQPVAGVDGPRQAADLPRPPHQGRQRPARHNPGPAARRHPRHRLRDADRRRRQGRKARQEDRASWRKVNAAQRAGQGDLFSDAGIPVSNTAGRAEARGGRRAGSQRADPCRRRLGKPSATPPTRPASRRCGRGGSPTPGAPRSSAPKTADGRADHARGPGAARGRHSIRSRIEAVDAIAARHRLFHWHLEFPEIFAVPDDGPANTPTGWTGGFSATLGNPPWERVKLQEQEFFAARDAAIAEAKNAAARKKAIAALEHSNPELFAEFNAAKRQSEAESHFLRSSGRFPLCGVGDVNTYSVFAEHFRSCLGADRSQRHHHAHRTGYRRDDCGLLRGQPPRRARCRVLRLRQRGEDLPRRAPLVRFAVSSMTGGETRAGGRARLPRPARPRRDRPDGSAWTRTRSCCVNPNTGTLPLFRSRRDAEITLACYRRHPVLIRDGAADGNPWGLRFGTLFHMANDSGSFVSAEDLERWGRRSTAGPGSRTTRRWLPLYEAKMLSHWNHRFSTYAGATQAQLNVGLPATPGRQTA